MSYFRECPRCGAHLDACEICDCLNPDRTESEPRESKEKTAQGAANTQDGEVEPKGDNQSNSALIVPGGERECQG